MTPSRSRCLGAFHALSTGQTHPPGSFWHSTRGFQMVYFGIPLCNKIIACTETCPHLPAAFACCASSQRYVASLSASVSLHLSQIDGLSGVDMATNNLTMRPEDHSPSDVNLRWPTCSDDTKHLFHLTEVEAALIVLLACVLASNWQLRRKNSNNSRPRGQSKRDMLAESTVQRSRWHFDWVSVVDLSLRLYSLLLCALLPFDRHVDQDGQLKQHTRYCCSLLYRTSSLDAFVYS